MRFPIRLHAQEDVEPGYKQKPDKPHAIQAVSYAQNEVNFQGYSSNPSYRL
jgi:hypothetical protein